MLWARVHMVVTCTAMLDMAFVHVLLYLHDRTVPSVAKVITHGWMQLIPRNHKVPGTLVLSSNTSNLCMPFTIIGSRAPSA